MARGKLLNETEIKIIKKLKAENKSNREIAKILSRSPKVINNYFKNEKENLIRKKLGRPSKVSPRKRRAILKAASNSTLTLNQIKEKSGVDVHKSTIYRILRSSEHISYRKIKQFPDHSEKHQKDRLNFAQNHISWKDEWHKVVFTDEKKFNLDGPDGYRYYFHDLRKEEVNLARRQMGGGSVMIWGVIGYNGVIDIEFISGRMNAKKYCELLARQKSKIQENLGVNEFIFQQDNAAVHTAGIVKRWFPDNNVQLLQWPAKSPDLNLIENVWGYLSRKVFANGKQFETVEELKISIKSEWNKIPVDYIRKLYISINKRLCEVLIKHGKATNY